MGHAPLFTGCIYVWAVLYRLVLAQGVGQGPGLAQNFSISKFFEVSRAASPWLPPSRPTLGPSPLIFHEDFEIHIRFSRGILFFPWNIFFRKYCLIANFFLKKLFVRFYFSPEIFWRNLLTRIIFLAKDFSGDFFSASIFFREIFIKVNIFLVQGEFFRLSLTEQKEIWSEQDSRAGVD